MEQMTFIVNEMMNWRAALDIVIIATTLFFLFRTLERLGTLKILIGIGAALVIYLLARLLHLDGTEWLFQNVSQVAVLALIVIFQPELRKILEKLVSLQGRRGMSDDPNHIAQVAESLWQLAKEYRGALIVYPGKEPIAEKLTGGTALSAEVSVPLLLSIFDPNSPGHDGAVIIENSRLQRFGVRLPMSQTSRLPEKYGTRHHAAMGLAEQTDALVLAVSEERGTVSAFQNGTMTRVMELADLMATISDHQGRIGTLQVDKINHIHPRAALQAAACLVVALVFWVGLVSGMKEVVERTVTMPIEYTAPAEGLTTVGDMTDEAKIRLNGPRAAIEEFLAKPHTLLIDLAKLPEGKQNILISADQLPGADAIFQASAPSHVEVRLAKLKKIAVSVKPQLVGELPPGYQLKAITVKPDRIEALAVPLKKGTVPQTVSTTPIYLNSIQGDISLFCKIIAPASLQPAEQEWPDVEVVVETRLKK